MSAARTASDPANPITNGPGQAANNGRASATNGHSTIRGHPTCVTRPIRASPSARLAGACRQNSRPMATQTIVSAATRRARGVHAIRRAPALGDPRRDRASVTPVKYSFAVTSSNHIDSANRARPATSPDGNATDETIAANSNPSCDRMRR